MKTMENKIVHGGKVLEDKEKEAAHQKRQLQLKLEEE